MEGNSQNTLSFYDRPTLPSIHSLNLPNTITSTISVPREFDHAEHSTTDERTKWRRARQDSIASTTSSCTHFSSRSTPPCDSDPEFNRSSTSPPPTHPPSNTFSLIRSNKDEANAFVLVPPQQGQYVENISAYSRSHASAGKSRRNQALLLVGPALEYLRHPRVRIAKGTRLHPYRIVSQASRRQSTGSTLSSHETTD